MVNKRPHHLRRPKAHGASTPAVSRENFRECQVTEVRCPVVPGPVVPDGVVPDGVLPDGVARQEAAV
jgi:hypothetical protein